MKPLFSLTRPDWWAWLVWLGVLTGVALWVRPAMPLDETRYLAVAWEMWLRDDFLVPFINGQPYSHKPPLLFWLIHAGWWFFGVNDWWPRLLSPLLALMNVALTWRLARRLWPESPEVARLTALVLLSGLLWLIYSQALMFDILISSCALLGLTALLEAGLTGRRRWWLLFSVSVALGVLAKGPAILVHLLPVALAGPLWFGSRWSMAKKRWYAAMTLSVLLGAGLALLWAIPAGQHGGEVYRHAIFWGQTANRMVSSFAHQRPAWWYGMMLPVFLFPWLFWPRLLGALWRDLRDQAKTTAPQFVLIWLAGGFLIFSAISGKQPHYLLPEMPAAALLISHAALRSRFTGRPWLPATLLFVIGGSVTYYAISLGYYPYFTALGPIPFWAGAGFLLAGGLSLMACRGDYPHLRWLAWANWVAMVWILLIVVKPLATLYDTQPLAQHIARYQESGREVGHAGKYHAQFQFSGRLTQPLTVLQEYALPDWLEQHQTAVALIYLPTRANITPYQPLYAQPFHTRLALIVDYHAAAALRQKHDSEVLEKEND